MWFWFIPKMVWMASSWTGALVATSSLQLNFYPLLLKLLLQKAILALIFLHVHFYRLLGLLPSSSPLSPGLPPHFPFSMWLSFYFLFLFDGSLKLERSPLNFRTMIY
jgi:hypothetical protein